MRLQTGVLLHFHRKQVGQGPGAIHVLGVNGEGLEMFDPSKLSCSTFSASWLRGL